MMHKWEKISITSYSTDYICSFCSEFYQAWKEEGVINLPPMVVCSNNSDALRQTITDSRCVK